MRTFLMAAMGFYPLPREKAVLEKRLADRATRCELCARALYARSEGASGLCATCRHQVDQEPIAAQGENPEPASLSESP